MHLLQDHRQEWSWVNACLQGYWLRAWAHDDIPASAGEIAQRAEARVICYLAKPFDEDDLLGCAHSALAHRKHDGKGS